MSDLISRQNAIKGVKELFACADIGNDEYDIIYMLENLPSADTDMSDYCDRLWKIAYERGKADRPTGEWVDDCTCSICHWMHEDNNGFALITKYNYCPNCGAKMGGDD